MSDKFLGSGGGKINISNGTANIYAGTLGSAGLDPSQPIKTNSVRQLVSSKLSISDVTNLQGILNNTLTNPYNAILQVNDLITDDTLSLNTDIQKIDNFTASVGTDTNIVGTVKVPEVATGRVSDSTQATFIDLDGATVAVNANDLTLNAYSVVSELGGKNLDTTLSTTQTVFSTDQELVTKKYVDDNGGGSIEKPNNNIVAGVNTGISLTTGNNNILLGPGAGQNVSTGSYNYGLGDFALNAITTQTGNIAIGQLSQSTSTGVNNISVGHSCLRGNISGNENVGMGVMSGFGNTIGSSNTYMGFNSGLTNDIHSFNTGIGHNALRYNKEAFNTAIGVSSQEGVFNVSTALGNTSVGYDTLRVIETGGNNTCLGINTGGALTVGLNNTFIGANSGGNQVFGSKNTAIGYQNSFSVNSQNSTVIGSGAICDADNQVCIGDANITEVINTGDGVCDLGSSTHQFKDIHLSGNVITNSNKQLFNLTGKNETAYVSALTGSSVGVRNDLYSGEYITVKSNVTASAGRVMSFEDDVDADEYRMNFCDGNTGEQNASSQALGILMEDCTSGMYCNIAVKGICSVLVDSTTTAQRGCLVTLAGSASSGQGRVVCTSRTSNEPSIGICMSDGARSANEPIVVFLQSSFESY